ncbi:hypothetical protein JXM67_07610 [candidate division WOR-3 bacterium]|nr:hypothetical protein [candidate division WOR-3 bacterium]
MRRTQKIILVALTMILLLGATPVFTEIEGKWKGTGTGNCHPHPGMIIFPWSVWEGKVYVSEDENITILEGEWKDELGNHGTFQGRFLLVSSSPDERICTGRWTWFDPTVNTAEPVFGGKFRMVFHPEEAVCEGNWTSIWVSSGAIGTMEGQKVN